jgi:hypothetical protein
LKGDLIFVDEEGVPRGIPKLSRLYFLDISWGDMGIPKLELCPYFISSYHSPFPTLENFLHTKLHTIFISNISVCKIVNPLFGSVSTQV